jgi:tetratricopeptide (TPR) repeat protein
MLETIREFALDRLVESGEHDTLRDRHAAYFSQLLRQPDLAYASARWLRRAETDHANLQAAWRWLVDRAQAERAYDLAANLANYAFHRGDGVQSLIAIEDMLARRDGAWESEDPAVRRARAGALLGIGRLLTWQVRLDEGRAFSARAVAIYQDVGDRWNVAHARLWVGIAAGCQGHVQAAGEAFEQSLEDFRSLGDQLGIAWSLHQWGGFAVRAGRLQQARELLDLGLETARGLSDPLEEAIVLGNRARLAYYAGDLAQSRRDALESLDLLGEFASAVAVNDARWLLAVICIREGDHGAARSYLTPILAFCRDRAVNFSTPFALEGAARLMAAEGNAVGALRVAGAVAAFRASAGHPLLAIFSADLERGLTPARQALGEAEQAQAWVEGTAMTFPQAIQYALDGVATPVPPDPPNPPLPQGHQIDANRPPNPL